MLMASINNGLTIFLPNFPYLSTSSTRASVLSRFTWLSFISHEKGQGRAAYYHYFPHYPATATFYPLPLRVNSTQPMHFRFLNQSIDKCLGNLQLETFYLLLYFIFIFINIVWYLLIVISRISGIKIWSYNLCAWWMLDIVGCRMLDMLIWDVSNILTSAPAIQHAH